MLAAAAASALLPASASGAVRFDDEGVVVTSGGDRVVVDAKPFRVAVLDGRCTVLRSVRGPRRAKPRRLPPTRDPEPLAREEVRDNAV